MNNQQCNNSIVEYKRIEEVCEILVGGEKPDDCIKGNKKTNEYKYPVFSNNSKDEGLYGYSKKYVIDKKSVTVSSIGTIGFHKVREPFYTHIIRLKVLIPKDKNELIPEFLNYCLDLIDFSKIKKGQTLQSISASEIRTILIPIPHISIQNKIVEILDKLETYTKDIQSGLPLEIDQRKKQYEYYRDKLLDFKDLAGGY
ncbi:restriction endonuclease subunit S [Metamycoplasma hominis]|nr:restriction endonuclease subunit S [Metamycoplasma hominis]